MKNFVPQLNQKIEMEYWSKHLLSFFLTCVLSNIIFVIYLKTTSYSGGEIGMAPLITFLNVAITFVISLVVLICLRMMRIKVPFCAGLAIFNFVSALDLFIYFRINPFEGYLSDVDLWALISVVIAGIIICLSVFAKKKFA